MDDNGYVALSEKVTATFYDDEHEEWTQRTVTIADVLDSVCDDYTVLPSSQTERPTGHWIIYPIYPCDGEDVKCSECGKRGCAPYWDYCPGCGAKMEGVENE